MNLETMDCKRDRMRYTKDSFSATLALLAIVFDCLYFVSIYQSDVGSWYYNWVIGASVIYNLVFLLAAFLASESVKNRKKGYSGVLALIGILQFVRVLYLPAKAHAATALVNGVEVAVMENGQYLYVVACLVISGICCLVAAVTSYKNNKVLADYMRSVENQ
nr:hypothetical protein [Oscillospiraceae bacterium]